MTPCPAAHWQPRTFILLQLASILLLASWCLPATKALWHVLDVPVFRLLNGSLGHWPAWDFVWALLSTRVSDLLAAVLMLCSLVIGGLIFEKNMLRRALVSFVALLVFTLVVRTLFTRSIDAAGLQHASPSVFLGDGFSLSQAFPWMEDIMEIKDRSSRSFPGDHASVLLLWTAFLSLFTRGKRLLLVWLTGIFLILPRLVAGAHWLSDNLVGGGFVVMQTLAWGYYTAAGHWAYRFLDRLGEPFVRLARKIPVLNRMAILQAEQH
ncbi:MAG: phosphatase PAP2 family protein [Thiopseudomonas sp.]